MVNISRHPHHLLRVEAMLVDLEEMSRPSETLRAAVEQRRRRRFCSETLKEQQAHSSWNEPLPFLAPPCHVLQSHWLLSYAACSPGTQGAGDRSHPLTFAAIAVPHTWLPAGRKDQIHRTRPKRLDGEARAL